MFKGKSNASCWYALKVCESNLLDKYCWTVTSCAIVAVTYAVYEIEQENPEKKNLPGFNGIRTQDLCDTETAFMYLLSYEAT